MGQNVEPAGEDLPQTPAGRQAAWFFRHSLSQGRDLTVEEVAEHMAFGPPWQPVDGLDRFRREEPRAHFTIRKLTVLSPFQIEATIDYGDGKPWKSTFTVEEEAPHRIVDMMWVRAIPDNVVVRLAEASDGPRLADLERRAPMVLSSLTLTYDRGDDFLAFTRLMANNFTFVADDGTELLGLACGALHRVRIGGTEYPAMLLHHVRVPIEHRGGGTFSAINNRVFGAFPESHQAPYGYTALDNAQGMRLGGPGSWSFGPYRAVLDCADRAGAPHGRAATPDDAPLIIDILNRCHDREEMFLPYTAESLASRLERAPDLYSWGSVRIGDGAVVGVWPSGVTVTAATEGVTTQSVRAIVLDHGCLPGAEAELERLLRGWCGELVGRDHTQLSVLISEGSPTYETIAPLASGMDPFTFRMAVPEPEGAKERGLYVDAVYF